MAAFSKFIEYVGVGTPLKHTCFELAHSWNPSCVSATAEIFNYSFVYSFKVYSTLYIVAALLNNRKRQKKYFFSVLPREILRSSLFLSTNAGLFIGSLCLSRKFFGVVYPWTVYVHMGIPASLLAILIESKARRGLLALYMTTLAGESFFNLLKILGMVTPIKYGEVMLFSLAMSIYLYLFRCRDGLPPGTQALLSYLFGSSECVQDRPKLPGSSTATDKLPSVLRSLWSKVREGASHSTCRHHNSCLSYVLEAFVMNFVGGTLLQLAIKLLPLIRTPSKILPALLKKQNLNLGLFFGLLSSIFKCVNCVLRWLRNEDREYYGGIAGLLAGLSFFFYRSSSISLYAISKLAETLYSKGARAGHLPSFRNADLALYTLSTAYVLHRAVFDPETLRSAYWKFLNNLTGNRLGQINHDLMRPLLYGTH